MGLERMVAMILILFVAGLITLDVAALLWGADSRDGIASEEWQRRAGWAPFA
jgi:hypothetical protein